MKAQLRLRILTKCVLIMNRTPADLNKRWKLYYELLSNGLRQHCGVHYLTGLQSIGVNPCSIDLEQLSHAVSSASKWQLAFIDGSTSTDDWFGLIAEKRFPIVSYIRPLDEIRSAQQPDMFHDIIGHVPYFGNREFVALIDLFSEMWRTASDPAQRKILKKVWFYFFEFSTLSEGLQRKIFGSGILSSLSQTLRFEKATVNLLPFSCELLRDSEYEQFPNGEPDFFMHFTSFDSLRHSLLAVKERTGLP